MKIGRKINDITNWLMFGGKNSPWDQYVESQPNSKNHSDRSLRTRSDLSGEGLQILQSLDPELREEYSAYPIYDVPAIFQINKILDGQETAKRIGSRTSDEAEEDQDQEPRQTCTKCVLEPGWKRLSDRSAIDNDGWVNYCFRTIGTWERIMHGECLWIRLNEKRHR